MQDPPTPSPPDSCALSPANRVQQDRGRRARARCEVELRFMHAMVEATAAPLKAATAGRSRD